MQRSCQSPRSTVRQKGLCREVCVKMLNLRSRSVPIAQSPRLSADVSSTSRRLAASGTSEQSVPTMRAVPSYAAMRAGISAAASSGSLATIMGPDGKSSSLRKLVVDGVNDSGNVQVKFCLKYRTSYGQSVKIIGSHPKLGFWDVNKALPLTWTEGDRWVATVELPAGSVYEYKYVLVDHDGRSALAWQGGGNSVLALGDQDEQQGVEVQDNWGNNPGQAAVIANGQSTTREGKLQAWAEEMRQYRALARSAQFELTRKSEELQASKAQVARLKMELSLSVKARDELEGRLAEAEAENLSLRAQVAQSQLAMRSTLEEAIKLLQQEIDEEEGDEETAGELFAYQQGAALAAEQQQLGEEELALLQQQQEQEQQEAAEPVPVAATTATASNGNGHKGSSSNGGGVGIGSMWGWGRSTNGASTSTSTSGGTNGSSGSSGSGASSSSGAVPGNGNGSPFAERFGFRMSGNGSAGASGAGAGGGSSSLDGSEGGSNGYHRQGLTSSSPASPPSHQPGHHATSRAATPVTTAAYMTYGPSSSVASSSSSTSPPSEPTLSSLSSSPAASPSSSFSAPFGSPAAAAAASPLPSSSSTAGLAGSPAAGAQPTAGGASRNAFADWRSRLGGSSSGSAQ